MPKNFLAQSELFPTSSRQHCVIASPDRAYPLRLASCGKATATMAHPSGTGGTSLAPTPTHPHHLSRESSREELEMAESLRRLNQVQDAHMSNTGSPLGEQQSQPGTPQDDQKSEIYHSLEDAVPIAGASASPTPTTSLSLPPRNAGGSSAPIIGQVCRYVAWLVSRLYIINTHISGAFHVEPSKY